MKFFKNKFLTVIHYKPIRHQTGGVEVFIVIVVILIAFLLAGGEFLLGSAFPLPDSLGLGGGTNKTPIDGGSGNKGAITIQNKGCIGVGKERVSATTVIVTNSNTGYISLEISNGAGGFAVVDTKEFKNIPTSVYELNLPNELGFNSSPWRVRLFEGGTNNGGSFTGGKEKASENGTPTNC